METLGLMVAGSATSIEVDVAKVAAWIAVTGFGVIGLLIRAVWNAREETITGLREKVHANSNLLQKIDLRLESIDKRLESTEKRLDRFES